MTPDKITSQYLHELQAVYHRIDKRGIVVSKERLDEARKYINDSIRSECDKLSTLWGIRCYIGAANKEKASNTQQLNLNSSSGEFTTLKFLGTLGYNIPKVSGKDEDGNYITKESLNELVLQKMFALNQFNILGGDPAIKSLLKIRELATLNNRYVNANLFHRTNPREDVFLTNYNIAGTVTGRRGSRKHAFGFGGNAQNFPKHGQLAEIYRRCLIARPGKIFLMVDQIQAEDWPTSCLAENEEGLNDLRTGIDRHRKLACLIFDLPWAQYSDEDWKKSIERYLGKKFRHANNYGMQKNTASDSLAKEGHSITPAQCQHILNRVNIADPSVDKVFHKFIKDQLSNGRKLTTPFGRERYFLGLRNGESGSNTKIFNEAYSYVPQSTVGDNTGFTVLKLEQNYHDPRAVILQESHDSITQELDDSLDCLWDRIQCTQEAFRRTIRFHNGLEIEIPVEGELAYDFASSVTLKSKSSKKLCDLSYADVQTAYYKLQQQKELEENKCALGDSVRIG